MNVIHGLYPNGHMAFEFHVCAEEQKDQLIRIVILGAPNQHVLNIHGC